MAQEPPAQDLMHYEAMAQEALRGVVRAALRRANAPGGLPGAHHFYLTFKTGAAGVEGPEELLSRYPDEMTIVLQHQFWDLEVGDETFGVTLKFGGRPQSLVVPYAPRSLAPAPPADSSDTEAPNVVSLDHFRKK